MSSTSKIVKKEAEELFPYTSRMRRYFHMHPEVAAEEFNTASVIEKELDDLGLFHERTAGTGVYTQIAGERPGDRTIVLRADIDALPVTEEHECEYKSTVPGKMHACGHDGHTACLLAAARILRDHRDLFGGNVRIIFQPGEEIGYGARIIVSEGYLDGADRTFGLHMASYIPVGQTAIAPGPNCASVDWFEITVHGKTAHVCTPHEGVDAIYIASQIVVAAQALVSRCTDPMENALIGIGKLEAGSSYNIVADCAKMEGTIRVFSQDLRVRLKEQLEDLAGKTAQIYGGSAEIKWKDYTSALINDETSCLEAQKTASALFGDEAVLKSRTPMLSGDDFAEFMLRVPGVYAFVGSANADIPETCASHHDSHFDLDERALIMGSALYAGYAMDFLNEEV